MKFEKLLVIIATSAVLGGSLAIRPCSAVWYDDNPPYLIGHLPVRAAVVLTYGPPRTDDSGVPLKVDGSPMAGAVVDYKVDGVGNRLTAGGTTYNYDAADRLYPAPTTTGVRGAFGRSLARLPGYSPTTAGSC